VSQLIDRPPQTRKEPVTDVMHGVPITDPYRWLEDQESSQTRAWIEEQTSYTRSYLDGIPGCARVRQRIHEFLSVETYDSLQKAGNRYFFRKRLPTQEQPCIYMRDGVNGADQLLIDPAERGSDKHLAVKPVCASSDGRLLLFEVKQGGERTGVFELFDVSTRRLLSDSLPRGCLRGFAFASDGNSFYYAHESLADKFAGRRTAYEHRLGTSPDQDRELFSIDGNGRTRLIFVAGLDWLVLSVYRFLAKTFTDVYVKRLGQDSSPTAIVKGIESSLGFGISGDRFFAITDHQSPNRRIVEIRLRDTGEYDWIDVIPETDCLIHDWFVTRNYIFVSYIKRTTFQLIVFDLSGKDLAEIPLERDRTVRITGGSPETDELFLEVETFTEPIAILRYSAKDRRLHVWSKRTLPVSTSRYAHLQVSYSSKDGTRIPMFLLARRDVLQAANSPTILTSYGGYGVSMTPKFSVFVAFLIERGCLVALPGIRGGSEFGAEWHKAAQRQRRQTAFDDFLCSAEWLLQTHRTAADKLAIFGGSNSGLLVSAAITQRPDLFRAAVSIAPLCDMLRYHLFDNAHIWREEFGTSEDAEDFGALRAYSPYHQVRDGVDYPATMIVSGDADQVCNALHARKMTARLQAANCSASPIILDYNPFRGHSPVLPFTDRVEALTDRMIFLCEALQLPV
jgi:prolyl oligopeptidase